MAKNDMLFNFIPLPYMLPHQFQNGMTNGGHFEIVVFCLQLSNGNEFNPVNYSIQLEFRCSKAAAAGHYNLQEFCLFF